MLDEEEDDSPEVTDPSLAPDCAYRLALDAVRTHTFRHFHPNYYHLLVALASYGYDFNDPSISAGRETAKDHRSASPGHVR